MIENIFAAKVIFILHKKTITLKITQATLHRTTCVQSNNLN